MERALKNEDFPTFGRPAQKFRWYLRHNVERLEQTYDTDLEVVSWTAEEDLFLLSGGLFGRHPSAFLCFEDGGHEERSTLAAGEDESVREARGPGRRTEERRKPSESISCLHRLRARCPKSLKERARLAAEFQFQVLFRLSCVPTHIGNGGDVRHFLISGGGCARGQRRRGRPSSTRSQLWLVSQRPPSPRCSSPDALHEAPRPLRRHPLPLCALCPRADRNRR